MFGRNKQEFVLKSLLNHVNSFDAALQRHEHWVNEISHPELEKMHLEIIRLIRQTLEKYAALVAKYDGYTK